MPPTLDVRLLGPLEVRVDGEVVDLGPPRHRALVALLALTPNRVVSTDQILEALWGEEADSKEKALWVYVSRLRSALEPDRSERGESALLVRRDPGYLLAVQPGDLDAVRFEESVAEARALVETDPAGALGAVEDALGLWRGDALEEFRYEDFAAGEIRRLEELRLEALEIRFEVALGLGRDRELVGQLEQLAREHPYREGITRALMLALYRSGRQAEALRAFERHARTIGEELGLEPSPELRTLEEQVLLQDESLRRAGELVMQAQNPYRGLRPFGEDHAVDFHGRGRLTAEILRRLERRDGLVAVVGASGSGKSSVVRAGVVPLIRKGSIEGSDHWQVATMVPAAHPFTELEVALAKSTIEPVERLGDALRSGAEGILHAALRVLPHDDARLLLVIDQFEELFTLVEDPSVAERFLDALVVAANDSRNRVTILLTLRADFYDRPLQHPVFGPLLGPAQVNVTPMTGEELEEAASLPAREAGVTIEPSLLSQLVVDVSNQPSALPMFQYALTELYERRDGSVMRLADYQEMGGIRGAIAHRANSIHEQLSAERKEAARQLFLRLVARSSDGVLSRRRVPASAVTSLDVDVVALQAVLQGFGEARLLTFDRSSEGPTVEVGHEALLTEWDLLAEWIGGAGADLDRHASLVAALEEWERSGRNEDYLARGAQLAEFEHLAGSGVLELNAPEMEFLGSALDRRSREVELEEERQRRTETLEARSRNRLRGLVATFALVALAAVILAVFVFREPPTIALVTANSREDVSADVPGIIFSGFDQAKVNYDFEAIEIAETGTTRPLFDVFTELGENEADLVLIDTFTTLAAEVRDAYPDTWFVRLQAGDPFESGPNFVAVEYQSAEAAFLAGVAAAHTTETGVVGFVGGTQIPPVDRYVAGLEAGVAFADPSIRVVSTHMGTGYEVWDPVDPANGPAAAQAAESLFDEGADVVMILGSWSTDAILQEAAERTAATGVKRWIIGGEGDLRLDAQEAYKGLFLTSTLDRVDVGTLLVVDRFDEGTLEAGRVELGLADGGVDVSFSGGQLAGLVDEIEAARAEVEEGRLEVPSIPRTVPLPPSRFGEAAQASVTISNAGCELSLPEGSVGIGDLVVEVSNSNLQAASVAWDWGTGVDVLPGGSMTWFTRVEAMPDTMLCFPNLDGDPFDAAEIGRVNPSVGLEAVGG